MAESWRARSLVWEEARGDRLGLPAWSRVTQASTQRLVWEDKVSGGEEAVAQELGPFLLQACKGQTCEPRRGCRWGKPSLDQLKRKDKRGSRWRGSKDLRGRGKSGAGCHWTRVWVLVDDNCQHFWNLPSAVCGHGLFGPESQKEYTLG